jgi:formylglycine-generating enzyme required for sulfatase activity
MRTQRTVSIAALSLRACFVLLPSALLFAADPVVSNVQARQRAGTKLVDITYELADADSATVSVSLRLSSDGGTTWAVPCASVSGNGIGASVTPGPGKRLVWDASADWTGQWSDRMQVEIAATDAGVPGDEFALIPAGSFQMGDNLGDGWSGELPVHTVQVSAFHMGRYEVTKALWDEVYAWAVAHGYGFADHDLGKGSAHPVQCVTWYDCVKWCNARSEREGLAPCYTVSGATYRTGQQDAVVCDGSASGYRLPTEAEWEKAARGGLSGQRFPWGDTIDHSRANYRSYWGDGQPYYSYDTGYEGYDTRYNDGVYPYTSPVEAFPANGYGLYDMSGNVWEWCWEWWSDTYHGSSPGTDPRGPGSGSYRAVRGGNWDYDASYCRVAYRGWGWPVGRDFNLGIRLVRAAQ